MDIGGLQQRLPPVNFGRWQVSDTTEAVTPLDEVAKQIASPNIVCDSPIATLSTGPTPPVFLTATPVPTAAPTPTRIPTLAVQSAEEARLRVWRSTYDCFTPPAPLTAFSAYAERPGLWLVEGKQGTTFYGLWLVEADTGEIIAWDERAKATTTQTCYKAST
ncbi:MAG: hypothetical protein HY685_04220 [Chloroflexi bacterium]|nr:hypothetical protein [Chloroflexota bacterium]